MNKNELTKIEALKLITPVVDNEVSDKERKAFFEYIDSYEDVRKKYESVKRLKALVNDRCPRAKAPESLRKRVENYIGGSDDSDQQTGTDAPIYDLPTGGPSHKIAPDSQNQLLDLPYKYWLFSTAAGALVVIVIWRLFSSDHQSANTAAYNVEDYTYEHFIRNKGEFIKPTISTANLSSAEVRLASDYNMAMTIPELQNVEFKGFVYADFVPGFKVPMLEYYHSSENQYIYIFVFKIAELKEFGRLARNQEAIKICNKSGDFHIKSINGKSIVSWKWGNVWYSAISNHHGNTLASLIKPLQ